MTALEDVQDVERFVRWQVNRGLGKRLDPSDTEEAVLEGIAIMYELHRTWDSDRCPRFSALALELLSRRLISWWRKNLRQSGRGNWNGEKGEYIFRQVISLEDANRRHEPSLVAHQHAA